MWLVAQDTASFGTCVVGEGVEVVYRKGPRFDLHSSAIILAVEKIMGGCHAAGDAFGRAAAGVMGLGTWLALRSRRHTASKNLTLELPSKPGNGDFRGECKLGAYSYVNGASRFYSTEIGRFCGIGMHVLIGGPEHSLDRLSIHPFSYSRRSQEILPTRIGNDVWIGAYAYIRRGVKVGDGAVVGAHTIVTKDVPPYAVVVGSPARILRFRFSLEIIERLLALQWWQYFPERKIVGDWDKPIEQVVEAFETAASNGTLRKLVPKTVVRHQRQ